MSLKDKIKIHESDRIPHPPLSNFLVYYQHMPLINLEYDDSLISDVEAEKLSNAIRNIVSDATGIADVFVYANTARIKVQIAPVEIFVRMSAKINEENLNLMGEIKTQLVAWKEKTGFSHPINLTIIPMNWQIEIGI